MEGGVEGIFNRLLESTGGLQIIIRAIAAKDSAAIVRAATEALRKTLSIPMVLAELKSAELSNGFRKEGNLHYLNKNYTDALASYYVALAYAPNDSSELKLAYSNISAVLLAINAYRDCLLNIKAAQKDCPAFLRDKLEKRKVEADKKSMTEMVRDMIVSEDGMQNYLKFDVKKNTDIPCASKDVHVNDDKTVVAAKEIKSGTLVALERAFVSVQDEYNEYTSCYYCHKICLFFIPCKGCCKALFCSEECKEKCLEEYHRVECHIVAYMGTMYKRDVNKMAVRAAIKMSLQLGWDKLETASREIGQKRLKKSSVAEVFDCNNPLSLLSYNDQIKVSDDVVVNASLICASAMYCLGRVPGYLPEAAKKKEKAFDALSRIMLHLNTTFLRSVVSLCSAYDFMHESFRCGVQRNVGWFSFTSKLPHSCEPNLLVLGLNDHVALVALQRIQKGDQLTICYTEHFYEMNAPPCPRNTRLRQKRIFNDIQYVCNCRVCLLEWHSRSQQPASVTDRQQDVYIKYKSAMFSGDFKQQIKAISTGLDEFTGCVNTTQHRSLYEDLRRTLNVCQCAKDLNRSFGCVSKYIFMVDK